MKTFIVYDLDSQSSLLLANKKARKLRDIVQARRLEFSTQIFWQKKLIWKNKLPAEPKCWNFRYR